MNANVSPAPARISLGGVKKGRNVGQKVVTANRLGDGAVVYLTANNLWTEHLAEADGVEGETALARLALAEAAEGAVAGPYLMDVEIGASGIVPAGRAALRERIRAEGPTIHPQFARAKAPASALAA